MALIVAAGATNKEAAAKLFLSVKTIEAHLHRTYRKLDVQSRVQLRPSCLPAQKELARPPRRVAIDGPIHASGGPSRMPPLHMSLTTWRR